MITLEQAKNLQYGDVLLQGRPGGIPMRWRVNGKVQRWKREPDRIRVPLKYGLYNYGALVTADFDINGECDWLTLER